MTYPESLQLLESGDNYLAFIDDAFIEQAFDKRYVNKIYMHLLGASASMYQTLGSIQRETYRLTAKLDDGLSTVSEEDKANVLNLIAFLQGIQDVCLNMRRLAEVGTERFTFEVQAQNKSKKA